LPTVVIGDVHLGFHPADAKTPAGVGGAVPYFAVESFDIAVERVQERRRHPLQRSSLDRGRPEDQLRDPFGNVLGLVGP